MKQNPFKNFVEDIKKIRSRPPSKEVVERINNRVRKEEESDKAQEQPKKKIANPDHQPEVEA